MVGVGEVPVEEELVDDGVVVSDLGESGEELVDFALGYLFDQLTEMGEESDLSG